MDWILLHIQEILVGFYILEKIIHISPLAANDIVIDGIRGILHWLENLRKGY